ncbi:MAG: hypothetical protein S4CHLAM37_09090 [Chlamydiia bacterium]|nr:hypothetical protein [Chlamydiia bacterium]
MALLATAVGASLLAKLSERHGGKDLLDQTYSGGYRLATRARALVGTPFARTATWLTGNQWYVNANLPSLEVPPLLASVRRVEERARLELGEAEFGKFQRDLQRYLDNTAFTDQARLHVMATTFSDGWIDSFWEAMYCYGRECPIEKTSWIGYDRATPVNFGNFQGRDRLFIRGACMLKLAMDYKRELVAGVAQENMIFRFGRSLPIDAEKCLKCFGTYRVPGQECDTFVDHPESTHVVVMYKGVTYILDLMKGDRPKTAEELYQNLSSIDTNSPEGDLYDVNVLSSQKRADWTADRDAVRQVSVSNAAHMDMIESAMFGICIDDDATWSGNAEAAKHGFSTTSGRNFDLSFQVCCKPDGSLYIICSHGSFDATHLAPLIEYIYPREQGLVDNFTLPSLCLVGTDVYDEKSENPRGLARLNIEMPQPLKAKVRELEEKKLNEGLQVEEFVFTEFGKELLKAAGHPDSVIQMVFQLAYSLMESSEDDVVAGVNTYEALLARQFRKMRTFQGHPRSEASEAFVRAMQKPKAPQDDQDLDPLVDSLCTAVETLSLDSRTTMEGFSEDRHMFALYCLAKMRGENVDFLETCMGELVKYPISSSQVKQKHGDGGIFRPTEKENGYGLLYRVDKEDKIIVNVSSFVTAKGKTAKDFTKYLNDALMLVKPLLEDLQDKKKPA